VTAPLLEVRDLRAGYGVIEVLKGISLEVRPGEIVTLIGANGAGKTSTLHAVSGLLKSRAGTIRFDGRDVGAMPAHAVVRLGLIQSPEGRRIFPRMTVHENLVLGAFVRRDRKEIAADLERVCELFPILRERRHQTGSTLSGGEQQMLAVARALMARPRLLMLDEPSLGLAPLIVRRIFDVLRDINAQGTAILLVEQNARMALRLAHRGYVLETGTITATDSAEKLLHDERIQAAYLGHAPAE
jgi:branched-chain amino acid transport system ATP-binding protein